MERKNMLIWAIGMAVVYLIILFSIPFLAPRLPISDAIVSGPWSVKILLGIAFVVLGATWGWIWGIRQERK